MAESREKLKKEILKLLADDKEFRYALIGALSSAFTTREETNALLHELKKMREDFNRRMEELREDFNRRMDGFERRMEELREDFNRRMDGFERRMEELREDFNKMARWIVSIDKRLGRLERTVEKLTIDVEDEAREIVKHKLEEVNISIDIRTLQLPEAEINIYGANKEWCVVGEASLRGGVKLLSELKNKYKLLKEKYPEYLRKNIILVLYVSLPMPNLIKEARKEKIWLLKATEEFVPLQTILKK